MGLIAKSILIELTRAFAFALTVVTVIATLFLIGQQAYRMNLGVGPIARLMPFILPEALSYSMPAAILLASCVVYGRMAAAGEIIAAKSLGISPWKLIWPGIYLGAGVSILAVGLNDISYSWGHRGMQQVILQSAEEIAYGMLRAQKSFSNQQISIIVQDVEGRRLLQPVITFQAEEAAEPVVIVADEAELSSNLETNTLRVLLVNSRFEGGEAFSVSLPGEKYYDLPLAVASSKTDEQATIIHIGMLQIPLALRNQTQSIRALREEMAAENVFRLLAGDLETSSTPLRDADVERLEQSSARLVRLTTEPWRRWASGFACLAFTAVGVPLASILRRTDFISTFGMCFGPILVIYYPIFGYFLNSAKNGAVHPVSIFVADAVCILAGWYLYRYVKRW